LYGNPRATKDIDFLVAIDSGNLAKLQKALAAFGAPPVDMETLRNSCFKDWLCVRWRGHQYWGNRLRVNTPGRSMTG
jgi:hypothetical protein